MANISQVVGPDTGEQSPEEGRGKKITIIMGPAVKFKSQSIHIFPQRVSNLNYQKCKYHKLSKATFIICRKPLSSKYLKK